MAFYGRVALVTGGGSGVGKLCALRLADAGAKVAVLDGNEVGLQATSKSHPNIYQFPCDISNLQEVQSIVTDIEQQWGPLDRVTHAATIMPTSEALSEKPEQIHHVMRINYEGTVNIATATLPGMLERNRGDFICFGSVAGYALSPHLGAFCASKAAVNAWMEIVIHENRHRKGVRIHLACPSLLDTPLLNQAFQTSNPNSIRKGMQHKWFANPADVIETIEQSLEKGNAISFPGMLGKTLFQARRWMPSLLWKLILHTEYS
jgi:NAD(P)-dependent dehydrogenase (short-subunit alcohol dehydrogenase family)